MDTVQLDGEEDGPAVRALGSLFKLTQVFLWDNGSSTAQELPPSTETSNPPHRDDNVGSNDVSTTLDYSPLPEDLELIRQMSELGLPLAFQTCKEKKNGISKVRKRRTHKKNDYGKEGIENDGTRFPKVSEPVVVSQTVILDNRSGLLCSMPVTGQSEIPCYDNAVDASKVCFVSDKGQDLTEISCVSKETICTGILLDVAIDCLDCYPVLTDNVPKYDLTVNPNTKDSDAGGGHCSQRPSTEAFVDCGREELGGSLVESNLLHHISPANHVETEAVTTHCNSYENHQSLEEVAISQGTEVLQQEQSNNDNSCRDWIVCWDSFYRRNYYHNSITQVSTWFPPPGMEAVEAEFNENPESNARLVELTKQDLSLSTPSVCSLPGDTCAFQHSVDSYVDFADHYNLLVQPFGEVDSIDLKNCEEDATSTGLGDVSMMSGPTEISLEENNLLVEVGDSLDNLHSLSGSHASEWKAVARKRIQRKSLHVKEDLSFPLSEEYCTVIEKYWFQRYLLFSRFDQGIKMDEEGWFSVTPQSIARHHAVRCGGGIVVDGFTGVGGNAIQFARMGRHVIAVDIDPKKIEYARHNAGIYEVDGGIDFVRGDFFILAPKLKADTVFLSPPWGGPGYTKVKKYNMKTMLKPHDGFFLFNIAKEIAPKVVMFLPKNVDLNQLAELSLSVQPPWSLESQVEKNYLNGKLKAVTAYFSNTEACRK